MHILEQSQFRSIINIFQLLHDEVNFYIIEEPLPNGSLYSYIDKRLKAGKGPCNEKEVQYIARQLFQAIEYLHNIGIVHGDIRLENILISDASEGENSKEKQIKLIKFRTAHQYKHQYFKTYEDTGMYY